MVTRTLRILRERMEEAKLKNADIPLIPTVYA
jgi:hypothetical protein